MQAQTALQTQTSKALSPGQADLRTALAELRRHSEALSDLLSGKCLLWLGSGISRERFPDLRGLLTQLVEELRSRTSNGDQGCLSALQQIAEWANWELPGSGGSGEAIDLATPAKQWPRFEGGIRSLTSRYDEILGLAIEGLDGPDPVIHEILRLPHLYGDETKEPDAEHRLVALLIAEGVFEEIVTTNWDPLVEKATEYYHDGREISVIAHQDEVAGVQRPVLFKIHGCARKALQDGKRYIPYLVATSCHIASWDQGKRKWQPYKNRIRALIQERRSIVIGLSLQDQNLRNELVRCRDDLEELWRTRKLVFAKPEGNHAQKELAAQLANAQLQFIPLWAKPFLGALYWLTVRAKAEALFELAPDIEQKALGKQFMDGLDAVEDLVCRWLNYHQTCDHDDLWREFAAELPQMLARAIDLFREGHVTSTYEARYPYRPLVRQRADNIRYAGELRENAYHRLWLVAGSLALAAENEELILLPPSTAASSAGHCHLRVAGYEVRLFILAPPALEQLVKKGAIQLYPEDEEDKERMDESEAVTQDGPPHPEGTVLIFPRGRRYALDPSRRGRPSSQLPSPKRALRPMELWLEEELREEKVLRDFPGSLRNFLDPSGRA